MNNTAKFFAPAVVLVLSSSACGQEAGGVPEDGAAPGADAVAAEAAPTSRSFNANGLDLHYLDWGNQSARPLVLLHHINTQGHTWDEFARNMSRDYRVLALDMRGHGDSGWSATGDYTTEDYASDVTALMSQLDLNDAILLGGSTGGRVALAAAAMNPERVSALIMEDVGAVRPPSIAQGFTTQLERGDPEFDTVEEWAASLQGQNQRTPARHFLHLARHGTRPLPNGKLGLKRDPALLDDMRPLELWHYVESVDAPILLILGSESTIVGEDQQTRFREIDSSVRIETIQGAGHIVVHDRPEEFERTVREFLTSNGL